MTYWVKQILSRRRAGPLVVLCIAQLVTLISCRVDAGSRPTLAALAPSPEPSPRPTRSDNFVVEKTPTPATSPTESPATVPTQPSPTQTPAYIEYEVQAGDDTWTIAATHNISVEQLLAANSLSEDQPIHPGQKLRIPASTATTDTTALEYRVRTGDTFVSIATRFGISPRMLQQANPNIDESALQIGEVLRVPWDGVHIVGPDDTLTIIADQYQVTFDQLVQANKDLLDFSNLNHIEVGWEIKIPDESEGIADCELQPGRTAVVQHVVSEGEGLFCLAQKFGLLPATIINSNPEIIGQGGFSPGMELLIPPGDGALYTITAEDIERGVKLDHIVSWYSAYGPLTNIVDWQGNPLQLPLEAGQQLFIPTADPLAGVFDSSWLAAETPTADATTVVENGEDDEGETGESAGDRPPESGTTFSGPRAWLWDNVVARDDPGYCPYQHGSGWSGSLAWPVASREIQEDRHFRPGHEALDINTSEGSAVYAAESGVVIWAGYSSFGGGIVVWLAHGNFWHTSYVHLSEVAVGCGQQVSKGTPIGYSGMTGTSWPHLHFAVYKESTAHDPFFFLP